MTVHTLLDGTDCIILLDSGATKSFMSKQYYLSNKSLHGLPKFRSKAKVTYVGNRESDNILLITPITLTIQGHMFEICIMLSGILDIV